MSKNEILCAVKEALKAFGYPVGRGVLRLSMKAVGINRYLIGCNGTKVGIYDFSKRTFVD